MGSGHHQYYLVAPGTEGGLPWPHGSKQQAWGSVPHVVPDTKQGWPGSLLSWAQGLGAARGTRRPWSGTAKSVPGRKGGCGARTHTPCSACRGASPAQPLRQHREVRAFPHLPTRPSHTSISPTAYVDPTTPQSPDPIHAGLGYRKRGRSLPKAPASMMAKGPCQVPSDLPGDLSMGRSRTYSSSWSFKNYKNHRWSVTSREREALSHIVQAAQGHTAGQWQAGR